MASIDGRTFLWATTAIAAGGQLNEATGFHVSRRRPVPRRSKFSRDPGGQTNLDRPAYFAFYELASKGAAVVRTSEFRPYGCFLFKMGVIFDR